jgi:hypothetical protein
LEGFGRLSREHAQELDSFPVPLQQSKDAAIRIPKVRVRRRTSTHEIVCIGLRAGFDQKHHASLAKQAE